MKFYKGLHYLKRYGYSFNEGGGPINLTIWWFPGPAFMKRKLLFAFYVYVFGCRIYTFVKKDKITWALQFKNPKYYLT